MTLRCIESLGWELPYIIYDQATRPGVLDFTADMPSVRIIRSDPPVSVAEAWNRSLEQAWSMEAEEAIVVNNDIIFHPGAYQALLEDAARYPQYGIISMAELPEDLGRFKDSSVVPGCRLSAFLIRKWVWDSVGAFDTRFRPAYWEDRDYLRRVKRASIETAATRHASCSHPHFGSTPGLWGRIKRNYYYALNKRRYLQKWGSLE